MTKPLRILYSALGIGHGHESRARAMADEFNAIPNEAKVDYLFSGRDAQKFKNMGVFGDVSFRKGFEWAFNKSGEVSILKTILKMDMLTLLRDIRDMDFTDYDVVVTDFEPIVAWGAKWHNLKNILRPEKQVEVIGMSNQHAFSCDIPQPRDIKSSAFLWAMKHSITPTTQLGLHFKRFANQEILPPIVKVPEKAPTINNKILVYIDWEDLDSVIDTFKGFESFDFHIYTGKTPTSEVPANIHLHEKGPEFQEDLVNCAGLIASAGFGASSEAIQLGIPILVKPQSGQPEQMANGMALEEANLGAMMTELSKSKVAEWLSNLENNTYEQLRYPDVAKGIAEWIVVGDYSDDSKLALIDSQWQESARLTQQAYNLG